jgi:Fe2+ transport system protein FeoA
MYDKSYILTGFVNDKMTEREMTLADLKRGESATVVRVRASGPTRQRLLDFGFRPGEIVKVVRRAPLTDPIELQIHGSYLSLRCAEADLISVERNS